MSNKPHLSVSKFMMGEKEYRLSGWFSPNGLWNEEKVGSTLYRKRKKRRSAKL